MFRVILPQSFISKLRCLLVAIFFFNQVIIARGESVSDASLNERFEKKHAEETQEEISSPEGNQSEISEQAAEKAYQVSNPLKANKFESSAVEGEVQSESDENSSKSVSDAQSYERLEERHSEDTQEQISLPDGNQSEISDQAAEKVSQASNPLKAESVSLPLKQNTFYPESDENSSESVSSTSRQETLAEMNNQLSLLREKLNLEDSNESKPNSLFGLILLLWFLVVGWLLYQQIVKKDGKLKITHLENGFESLRQQISQLPNLSKIETIPSEGVKNHHDECDEESERSQSSEIESLHAKLDDTLRSFSTLKKTLDEKDRDIRQLRKGIDAEIYKGMIKKFIRLEEVFYQEINALSEDETKIKEILIDMCEIMQDTFFDCGVEEFSPKVGESIRTAFGTDDNYELVETEEDSLHLQIAEVKKSGYFLNSADGRKCLKESKVKVFVKKKNGEDNK